MTEDQALRLLFVRYPNGRLRCYNGVNFRFRFGKSKKVTDSVTAGSLVGLLEEVLKKDAKK